MMTVHKLSAGVDGGYSYLTRQVASADQRRAGGALADYYAARATRPGSGWARARSSWASPAARCPRRRCGRCSGRACTRMRRPCSPPGRPKSATKLGAGLPHVRRAAPYSSGSPMRWRCSPPITAGHRPRPNATRSRRRRPGGAVGRWPGSTWSSPRSSRRRCCGRSAARHVRPAVEAAHHEAVADDAGLAGAGGRLHPGRARRGAADRHHRVAGRGVRPPRLPRRRPGPAHPRGGLEQGPGPRRRPDGRPGGCRWTPGCCHAAAVAASERYNTRFEDALTRRLGVAFVERADRPRRTSAPVREIAGVPRRADPALLQAPGRDRGPLHGPAPREYRAHARPRAAAGRPSSSSPSRPPWRPGTPKAPPAPWPSRSPTGRAEAATVLGRGGVDRLRARDARAAPSTADDCPAEHDGRRAGAAGGAGGVGEKRAPGPAGTCYAETERQLRPLRFPPRRTGRPPPRRWSHALRPDRGLSIRIGRARSWSTSPTALVARSRRRVRVLPHGVGPVHHRRILAAEDALRRTPPQPTPARRRGPARCSRPRSRPRGDHRHRPRRRATGSWSTRFATDPRRLVGRDRPGRRREDHRHARVGAGLGRRPAAGSSRWRLSAKAAEVLGDELGCPGREPAQVPPREHHATAPDPRATRRSVVPAEPRRRGAGRRGRDGRHPPPRLARSTTPANAARSSGCSATPPSSPPSRPAARSGSSAPTPAPSSSPTCTGSPTPTKPTPPSRSANGDPRALDFYQPTTGSTPAPRTRCSRPPTTRGPTTSSPARRPC